MILSCFLSPGMLFVAVDPIMAATPVLTRTNNQFKLDGVPISRFGLRTANVLQDDTITQRFIDNLDTAKAHGLQSFSLSLQGGRYTEGGNSNMNSFNPDGTLKPEFSSRLARLLDAAAQKNMVPVVMYFYQGRDQELVNEAAVLRAVDDTTNFLKPWRNVWLHVINEWYHAGFDHSLLKTASGQIQIYNRIKSLDPSRITHVSDTSGAHDGFTSDTGVTATNGNVVIEYVRDDTYTNPGVFSDIQRTNAINNATYSFNNQGYWFWHAAWHQKADSPGWPRFDKGGAGTAASPGVSFIWNVLQQLSGSPSPIVTPTFTPVPLPSPSPSLSPTPIPQPTSNNSLVSNVSVTSGQIYEIVPNGLVVGALQYLDRSFTFSTVPAQLTGLTYIKTANDDKSTIGDNFLSFTVSAPVTLFVAHDDRISPRPSWLSVFSDTGDNLISGGGTFSLFAKEYPQGPVTLGGNEGGGNSMYSLILLPHATSLPGDLDGDGDVDFNDLLTLINSFNLPSALGDFNQSGLIDLFDFNRLISSFSIFNSPTNTPAPPPPSPTLSATGTTYYISPTGNDNNSGLSQSAPLATFTKAWSKMAAGDTLLLMDGTYTQTMEPTLNGTAQKPITLRALNDGKAILDGGGTRHVAVIGKVWDNIPGYHRDSINPYGNYVTVEGIVAKNSVADVWEVYARNVTLRRVSGFNANPHDNFHVITVWSLGTPTNPANILVEDSIAAGSGRKMIIDYDTYGNVVFRRNFAAWQWWLGDRFCSGYWPQSQGIENYPAAYQDQPTLPVNDLRENNLIFGLAPDGAGSFSPNPGYRYGNKILGEISLGGGMKWDNVAGQFVTPYYNLASCQYNGTDANHQKPCSDAETRCIYTSSELGTGFSYGIFSQPTFNNNLIQDLFSAYHGDLGFIAGPWSNNYGTTGNNSLVRATFVNNGLGSYSTRPNIDVFASSLTPFTTRQDLKIGVISGGSNPSPGEGAKLQYRYINGTLTNEPLWPWPMEDRIKTEFADPSLFQANGNQGEIWSNFSVTNSICKNILVPNGAVPASACP